MARKVRDVMVEPVEVSPRSSVKELSRILLERQIDGVCVVDEGRLVGVVTSMDLVMRDMPVHLPTVITIMDLVVQLPMGPGDREELRKVLATTVGELMSRKVISIGPDAPVSQAAERMVDKHLTVLPVVESGRLLGVVTKQSLLRASILPGDG